jgi:capsid protein
MSKPSLLSRLKIAGSLLWGGGSAWEGANTSPNRGRINGAAPSDFHHEFSGWARDELMMKMRYLRKNSGFVREYINTLALYSAPVKPQSLVEDHEWRKEAEELYADRRRIADVTGRFTGEQVQTLISKAIDTDGEIFVLKTIDRANDLPRLQLIEAHRVGDFGTHNTIDGIKVNARGRPTGVNVMQDNGKSRLIPMRGIMHVFDPESATALRHPSPLAHAINHRLDVEELLAIEKKGVKDNLEVTRIIQRLAGDDVDDDELNELLGGDGATRESTTDPKAMQKILGGKAFITEPGEKVESWVPNRPTPTFNGFIDILDRESALGTLPYEFFINPSKLNGAAARLITARVQRISMRRSQVLLERYLRPDWFFVIGTAIDNGELAPVKGWHRIAGGFPKQVTVDAGRNDESLRRNLEMGVVTPSEAFAEQGRSFEEAMEQKAQDLKALEAIAERNGIDPAQLFAFAAKAASAMTPPSAKEPR